jgi:hypothetical protein
MSFQSTVAFLGCASLLIAGGCGGRSPDPPVSGATTSFDTKITSYRDLGGRISVDYVVENTGHAELPAHCNIYIYDNGGFGVGTEFFYTPAVKPGAQYRDTFEVGVTNPAHKGPPFDADFECEGY